MPTRSPRSSQHTHTLTARASSRTRFVENYARLPRAFEATTVLRALVQCLTPSEVAFLLEKHALATGLLRDSLLRRINADAENGQRAAYLPTVRRLIALLRADASAHSRDIGVCTSRLATVLPTSLQRQAILALLNSRFVSNRRRAYKLAVSRRYRSAVQTAWEKHHDPEAAFLIVKHSPTRYVQRNARRLLNDLAYPGHRARLHIRIAPRHPALLHELRATDEISYVYVLTKLRRRITAREARAVVERHIADERLGLLLRCIGRQRLWPALRGIVKHAEQLQTRRLDEQAMYWSRLLPPLPAEPTSEAGSAA